MFHPKFQIVADRHATVEIVGYSDSADEAETQRKSAERACGGCGKIHQVEILSAENFLPEDAE